MTQTRLLILIAAIGMLAYWALLPWHPYPGSPLLKIVPAGAMAILALGHRNLVGMALALSLIGHAVGDVLLDVDRSGLFLPAMGAFFAGHILYMIAFRRYVFPIRKLPGGIQVAIFLLMAVSMGMSSYLLRVLEGPLLVAVPIYIAALTAMAFCAFVGRWNNPMPVVGAALFVLSDALIAVNTFIVPLEMASLVIWPTYALAQILIPVGVIQTALGNQELATSSA